MGNDVDKLLQCIDSVVWGGQLVSRPPQDWRWSQTGHKWLFHFASRSSMEEALAVLHESTVMWFEQRGGPVQKLFENGS